MQAIILAAGYSTRLRPLTESTPKPLLPIGDKPIMEWILERVLPLPDLTQVSVVVNHRFYSQFAQWHSGYCPRHQPGPAITLIDDGSSSNEDRLGAVGDICLALEQYADDDTLIVAGDNLFSNDLSSLCELRKRRDASVLGVHQYGSVDEVRKRFGVVTIDEDWRVLSFEEKPEHPRSTLAATAIYLLRKQDVGLVLALNRRPHPGELDAGCLIQELLGRGTAVFGHPISSWHDIGTPEDLQRARASYVGSTSSLPARDTCTG
jgi:glucose-1-phosphate thymidylyltransferase